MQAIAIYRNNHNGPELCAYKINGNNPGKIQAIAGEYCQYIKAGFVELTFSPAADTRPGLDLLRRDNKTGFKVVKSSGKQCRKKPAAKSKDSKKCYIVNI